MGFRVQLIAVTGKEPREIHRDIGVVAAGQCEYPGDYPVVGIRLPTGAYLLYISNTNRIVPEQEVFTRLSTRALLFACCANETVMNNFASGRVNGIERWSVFHDAQLDKSHLKTSGALPPEFATIRDRLLEKQVGDDLADYVFDVPVELFAALGGIRYDDDLPGGRSRSWDVLQGCE